PAPAHVAAQVLEAPRRDVVHLHGLDLDLPGRPDGVPVQLAVRCDVLEGVVDAVPVEPADRAVRVTDADAGAVVGLRPLVDPVRGRVGAHPDRVVGPQAGDDPVDPVLLVDGEVVVD